MPETNEPSAEDPDFLPDLDIKNLAETFKMDKTVPNDTVEGMARINKSERKKCKTILDKLQKAFKNNDFKQFWEIIHSANCVSKEDTAGHKKEIIVQTTKTDKEHPRLRSTQPLRSSLC